MLVCSLSLSLVGIGLFEGALRTERRRTESWASPFLGHVPCPRVSLYQTEGGGGMQTKETCRRRVDSLFLKGGGGEEALQRPCKQEPFKSKVPLLRTGLSNFNCSPLCLQSRPRTWRFWRCRLRKTFRHYNPSSQKSRVHFFFFISHRHG